VIFLTGASGKTGRAITAALAKRRASVRAMVRRPEQAAALMEAGAAETVTGDITSQADLERCMAGVESVYHICPNVHPAEVEIGQAVIAAAQVSGVRRVVYHSVLHPQVEAMPHHWKKMRVEEQLFQSGLDFTILQPAAYMQNTLGQLKSMRESGVYYSPYRVSARLSMVDLADVAEAAAKVLIETGHSHATYELCGAENLSQVEVAEAYSRTLGIAVQAREQDRADWEASARRGGMDGYALDTLLKMFAYYDRNGFSGSPTLLTCLLGRKPAAFDDFLRRVLSSPEN
jgi:uncharacterized protein YbjT (DUF2867 family)